MSHPERKLNLAARIGIIATLAVASLGFAGYEAGRLDFKNTFSHEPKLALALNDGLLEIGFVTPKGNLEEYKRTVDTCGKSEIFNQVIDPNGHPTRQLDFAATIFSAGNCPRGWKWFVRTSPLTLTPPTP